MTTKLNLVNDNIVALSVTSAETLVANNIVGDGSSVSNVDAVKLDGQPASYYLDHNNFTNAPSLEGFVTKTDSVVSNNAIKGLIDTKLSVSNAAALYETQSNATTQRAALQSDIDTKLSVANAAATYAPLAGGALTGTTSFESLSDGVITITAFVDEDNMASDSAAMVPTQQSVKAYVDSEINAIESSFTLSADSGSDDTFTTGGTLTFTGTTNEIETAVTNDEIQIGLPNNVSVTNNLTVGGTLNSDDITAAQVTVGGNAVITGNLTVQGTTTTVNSTEVTIEDSVLRVNSDGSVTSSGIEADIGGTIESVLYNPSTSRWELSGPIYTGGDVTADGVNFATLNDGVTEIAGFKDEDNMVSDSATHVPTQQSVKAYVDSQQSASSALLQAEIDDRMQVANVNAIQTTLQTNIDAKLATTVAASTYETKADADTTEASLQAAIDTKMAVSNVAAIQTTLQNNIDLKAPLASPALTGTATFENLGDGAITIAGFKDEDNMASDSATHVPTQQSVKAYVDSQVTAQDVDFAGDSGTGAVDLDGQSLTIAGGTGLSSTASGQTLTVALDDTAVDAGTYGTSSIIPSITVDAQGRVTNVSNTSITTSFNIAADSGSADTVNGGETFTIAGDTGITTTVTNNQVAVDLDDTAVTAGSYGSSTSIPTFTVDAQGRLTAAGGATISTDLAMAGDSGTDTVSLGTDTLSVLGTVNEVNTTVTNNQIKVGLTDSVSITNDLTVGGTLNSDDITAAQVTVSGSAVITGNLTVQGTTTTVNSTEVTIEDSVLRVNSDGTSVSSGIEADIGGTIESILYNPSTSRWELSGDVHTATNLSAADITFANLNDGAITVAGFVDEDNMASDSATLVPTQQSVKAYVDTEIASADSGLQAAIDTKMAVSNVVAIQTALQSSIDTKMAVANVVAVQTALQSNIDTKMAVANASLQAITDIGNTTTKGITVGSLTAASIAYPTSDGNYGQALITDGSGNLTWDTVARDPIVMPGNYEPVKLGSITTDGSTSYALAYANGASYSISNQNSLLVSLNGVIQEPGTSFTASGSTITFSSAIASDDVINFVTDLAPTGTFTITNETIATTNLQANTITINGVDVSSMITNTFDSIVDNAPATLNTLNELAAAMGDDQFFANTVTTSIAAKMNSSDFNNFVDSRLSSGSISTNIVTTGSVVAANFNTTSDKRLKTNVADAAPSSDIVDAIQVRQYDWKDSGKHDAYGFVAQELHTVYPAAVTPGETDAEIWTVDFSKLVPLLVKEIQDLKGRIAELEAK